MSYQNNYMPNNNMIGGMPSNNMMNNMQGMNNMGMNMNNMPNNMAGINNNYPAAINPQINQGYMNNNMINNGYMMNNGYMVNNNIMNNNMMNNGYMVNNNMMNNGYMGQGMNIPIMNQGMMDNTMMNMMANVYVIGQMQNKVLNELKNMQQQQLNMTQPNQNIQNNNNSNINNTNVNNSQINMNPGNDMISIVFQRQKSENNIDFKITIVCSQNDTIGQIIDKYLTKSLERREDVLFLFNAEEIGQYSDKTLKFKDLKHQSIIMVVNKRGTIAGI